MITHKDASGLCRWLGVFLCALLACALWAPQTLAGPRGSIEMISPAPGSTAMAKKPAIVVKIPADVAPEGVILLLDDNDITALAHWEGDRASVELFEILPSGVHSLVVYATDAAGNQLESRFSFTTRHYEDFDEAYVEGNLSAVWEGAAARHNADDWPDSRVEANLASDMKVKRGDWDISFRSNLRYQDQSKALLYPEQKGLSVADYLLRASYNQNDVALNASMGDVVVDMGELTANYLARRGGLLRAEAKGLSAMAFMVNSNQYWGFDGGLGLEADTDDHLMGARLGWDVMPEVFGVTVHYLTGGQQDDSFGQWSDEAPFKGDVWGATMWAAPLGQALTAKAEVNFSSTEDTGNGDADDKAWRVSLEGVQGAYSYNAGYEYIGPDYEVAANDTIENDRQGWNLGGRGDWTNHSLALNLGQYHDNVENSDELARTDCLDAGLDYSYNGLERWPMTLGYQLSTLDTSDEPAWAYPQQTSLHTVLGTATYLGDVLNLGMQANYSTMDDAENDTNDNHTLTLSLTPTLLYDNLSVSSAFTWSQLEYTTSSVSTDTFTVSLDLLGQLPETGLNWQVAGSYNKTKASDDSSDFETVGADAEISHSFGSLLGGRFTPSVALRGQYINNRDLVLDDSEEEFVVTVVFSADAPFSF